MSKIGLRGTNKDVLKKVANIIEDTVIIKRQLELEYGKWDFVVFGPKDKNTTVIREGFASHLKIEQSLIYLATFGKAGLSEEMSGTPIEEFTDGDIPEELMGLEILDIEPIRPLTITSKKDGPEVSKAIDMLQREYEDRNIAVIKSPEESYWGISILKYMNECDKYFPDIFTEAIKKGKLPINPHMKSGRGGRFGSGNMLFN